MGSSPPGICAGGRSCILVRLLRNRKCVEIGRQCGFVIATATVLAWGTLQPVFVHAETRVIPSVTLSERYDTNVFNAPPNRLPPGQRTNDFISTLGGGAQLLHTSRDVEASLTGGADLNMFAYMNELNYLSTTAQGSAKLDGWVGRFAEGARLSISDSFQYTPDPSAFVTALNSQAAQDPFARGIQGFRAKTYYNTISANGSYPVFRELTLQGGYSYSVRRLGSFIAGTAGGPAFFDVQAHRWFVGPSLKLTSEDEISLLYEQNLADQTNRSTGQNLSFTTQEGYASYTRAMQGWWASLRGGVTYLEPVGMAFPTGGVNVWTNPERSTSVQLELSRKIAPSFYFTSGANVSNVVQAQITHRFSNRLELRGSVNYSYSENVPARTTKFESLSGVVEINYMLNRTLAANLSYRHTNFVIEQPGVPYELYRNVVAIQLTAKWE